MTTFLSILANTANNQAVVDMMTGTTNELYAASTATGVSALAIFATRYAFIVLKAFFMEGGFSFGQFKDRMGDINANSSDGFGTISTGKGRTAAFYRQDGQIVAARVLNRGESDMEDFRRDVESRKYLTGVTVDDVNNGRLPADGIRKKS